MTSDEKPTEVEAIWSISIDTDCPECGEAFDITQSEDFWGEEGRDLKLAETAAIETSCPACAHAFTVRCVW